ncbi:30S ribosomal protein S17, chloroplastic [Phalaenopsis equestris]|uniref:30S ribosomal protein S17, chloroplastic n=1 Tax=Phalaenopsis equestris TaxID=78828 RepID=UPI0009E25DC8|nr:30S ribosomal protein S17, chloroplastic [Phalaenopsis equestris]
MLGLPGSFLRAPYSQAAHPSSFLNGSIPRSPKLPIPSSSYPPPAPSSLSIQAMKKLQGRVVCATNDKTVAVEVIRLAPHPKYKRRVRMKKKYQAHDPDNQFKVGDFVQLEQSRPISKTKTFIATPVLSRNATKPAEPLPSLVLDLPLQSQGRSQFQN